MDELWTVVGKLLNGETLDEKYHAHILSGDRKGQWECHIQPDWLLIWEVHDQELVLVLINSGSHSDLFGKSIGNNYIIVDYDRHLVRVMTICSTQSGLDGGGW